ncbi:hypothetical protein SR187_9195 [Streptococcus ruminantium]|uniref:Uncharacterized protein n=1 Tax=Streptococcus ruminantium TaxID=1917441 RepID=A0A2Z5U180_9STRE|nr:hypothetical protein SR187_9195 [Streptococcus ruminantium]
MWHENLPENTDETKRQGTDTTVLKEANDNACPQTISQY